MSEQEQTVQLPTAKLQPDRRPSWVLLIPLGAVLLAAGIGYDTWTRRGIEIQVLLQQGHGVHVGDDLRYRGIAVGQVLAVDLDSALEGVLVTARLNPDAGRLARAGTRFWVVRPTVGLSGIAGLDTLVGPRYLALLPGEGRPQRFFIGIEDPPIVDQIEAGDLEIVLEAPQRESVRPGAPVSYRQIAVGTVLSVGLTSDGSAVEARVHIQKAYSELVRPETKFWNVGKIEAQLGLKGMSIQLDSLETLVAGGIAMATPPDAGEVVRNGQRFTLYGRVEREWLTWEPLVPIGSSLLPPGAVTPTPLRSVLAWKQGLISSSRSRRGWVLQTEAGLLGPLDILRANEQAEPSSVEIEINGQRIAPTSEPLAAGNGLGLLDARATSTLWPTSRVRRPATLEDCLVIGDPGANPLPLAVARLTLGEDRWLIDPAVSVHDSWHGACVLARSDGKLVGLVLVEAGAARVSLVPPEWVD